MSEFNVYPMLPEIVLLSAGHFFNFINNLLGVNTNIFISFASLKH